METFISTLLFLIPFTVLAGKYDEVDQHALSVEYTRDYKEATQALTAPFETDLEKARAIFTWLAYHIEYDKRQLRRIESSDYKVRIKARTEEEMRQARLKRIQDKMETALKRKKGVCQDYSWLFQGMCLEAGIDCEFILGYGRTDRTTIGRTPKEPRHAWNAAKIDGNWELFDVTWSTEMFDHQADGFFMMTPEEFGRSHHPVDEKWQLRENPIRLNDWADQIFWHKSYSWYDVKSIKVDQVPQQDMVVPYKSELEIELDLPDHQRLYGIKYEGEKRVEFSREGDLHKIKFDSNRLKGLVMICVKEERKFIPLMEFKVR